MLWFAQKTGASANNLKDFMGFGSYETDWAWLHRLGRAMPRPMRDKLKEEVEVAETYIVSERKHPFFQKILLTKMILSHMGLFRFNSGANFSIKKLKLPIC